MHNYAANLCDAAVCVVLKAGHEASSSQAAGQPGSQAATQLELISKSDLHKEQNRKVTQSCCSLELLGIINE